jgi:hypothetical protein
MSEIELAIRALCILEHANRDPEWVDRHPHDKRVTWALGIVRQVAEQPMGKIDEEQANGNAALAARGLKIVEDK